MKYNVFYGQAPFNQKIDDVVAPNDRPDMALSAALKQFAGVIPEGVQIEKGKFYHHHPVVAPA